MFSSQRYWMIAAGLFVGISQPALAASSRDAQIQSALDEFRAHTRQFMTSLPEKFVVQGDSPRAVFSPEDVASGNYVNERFQWRVKKMAASTFRAPFADNDHAEDLVEDPGSMIRDPKLMDSQHLTTGTTQVPAWSDDYWPYYAGILGNRYGDVAQPAGTDWQTHYNYVTSPGHLFSDIWNSHDRSKIGLLSAAEKYDALTGNFDGPLTSVLWGVGRDLIAGGDPVEYWMGICDGWTAASYHAPRPTHSVSVTAADGSPVTFYPFDVKSLNSLLWEWTGVPVRFIGTRCNVKNPPVDPNGRIIDPACFDTNPGTWHLAVIHQVGKLKKTMIMDATYDYEIWNQPIRSYSYTYFNPQSGKPVAAIADAQVRLADFTQDKFRKYRSPNAASVVGIAMDLTYVTENEHPTQIATDSPAYDQLTTVRYLYDLELDSSGQIIGGEWYQNAHPDFLWMPEPGDEPSSAGDAQAVGSWNGVGPVPKSWAAAAASSARYGEPLAKVVQALTELAK